MIKRIGEKSFPALVLVAALTLTALAWRSSSRNFDSEQRLVYDRASEQIRNAVTERIHSLIQSIEHTRGLFDASREVTRDEFKLFVESLNLKTYHPAIDGVGFLKKVFTQDLALHEKSVVQSGLHAYRVNPLPKPEQKLSFPVVFMEISGKENGNLLGFDMTSEPTRSSAIYQSFRTAKTVLSKNISLTSTTHSAFSGFNLYAPVYSKGASLKTSQEREDGTQGVIFIRIRMLPIFSDLYAGTSSSSVPLSFEIFELAQSGTQSEADLERSRIFPEAASIVHKLASYQKFQDIPLEFAGTQWLLRTYSPQVPLFSTLRRESNLILISGTLISFLLFFLVRTVQKRAEEKSDLYQKTVDALGQRDEFLSIASHELKTPLTPIRLQLQYLQKRFDEISTQDAKDILKRTESSFDRLTSLVNELLDVSRARTGKLMMRPKELRPKELIEKISRDFAPTLDSTQCPLALNLEDIGEAKWDPARIEQVVLNLLKNAAEYAPGKPITVELRRDSTHEPACALLTVSDQGPGIDTKDQQRIFDRFERATSARHYGGLGLGLYISRQIIEAHGGRIRVESMLGQGATFVIELPLLQSEVTRESNSTPKVSSAVG